MTKTNDTASKIIRLGPEDAAHFDAALDLFAEVFGDPENYSSARPSVDYRKDLLSRNEVLFFVALAEERLSGALVAYELPKFEQERSEFYIYDLAVHPAYRRKGVATALIRAVQAAARGGVVFVQADHGDDPAVALYTKLGLREDVLHFDILP